MNLAGQIDKRRTTTFDPFYDLGLLDARNQIADGVEVEVSGMLRKALNFDIFFHIHSGEQMTKDCLSQILDWRNLPAYRLEPRFDPYLAYFLPKVVGSVVEEDLREFILPELPLQRAALYGPETKGRNKSTKVDFALFSRTGRRVILVEVKTDDSSRRKKQDKYLRKAKQVGWLGIVKGILAIAVNTKDVYVRKYDKLLQVLDRLNFIDYKAPSEDATINVLKDAIKKATLDARCSDVELDVYYVQPSADDDDKYVISFEQFASKLAGIKDPLAPAVAKALKRLATIPAGQSAEGLLDAL